MTPTSHDDGPPPNFAVYRAKRAARTYLVASTSAIRQGADPLRRKDEFEASAALDALARELREAFVAGGGEKPVAVTLKVHGFNTRRKDFEAEVLCDADPNLRFAPSSSRRPPDVDPDRETFRPGDRFFIGYRWPSEGMLTPGSIRDTAVSLVHSPLIGLFLLLLPAIALLWLGCLQGFLDHALPGVALGTRVLVDAGHSMVMAADRAAPALGGLLALLLAPYGEACAAATLLGAGLLFLVLRLSTYLRDRYRALHYGIPDLGEFLRALEERVHPDGVKLQLDVIGHSMGALLLINALRVMSDYFHGAGPAGPADVGLGRDGTFKLRTLVLCAADIPVVMATPDHNNYFLSVLRRFEAVHVFSSDRDIILKWLSSIANWASEPRYDMSGRKLGNVVLVRARPRRIGRPDSRADWTLCPVTRPVFRPYQVYVSDPIVSSLHPATLHFHDCTRDLSLSGTEAAVLPVAFAVLLLLWLASRVYFHGLMLWLLSALALPLALGLLLRPVWPWLRDRGTWGGIAGGFAEWPVLMMFLTWWVGWNPHCGYFMFEQTPRRRISAILRDPSIYPPRDARGREIEERDELIRYKMVRISV